MKKALIFGLMCFFGFLFLTNIALSAEIIQKYGPPDLTILEFVLVDSHQNGETLTRTFKLKVENKTDEPLYDVKFTLIHTSDQATVEKSEVCLGTVGPGQVVISSDDFIYSVDTSKVSIIPEVEFHWSIEYEVVGQERIAGEALVMEIL